MTAWLAARLHSERTAVEASRAQSGSAAMRLAGSAEADTFHLLELPRDIRRNIGNFLARSDLAALACASRAMRDEVASDHQARWRSWCADASLAGLALPAAAGRWQAQYGRLRILPRGGTEVWPVVPTLLCPIWPSCTLADRFVMARQQAGGRLLVAARGDGPDFGLHLATCAGPAGGALRGPHVVREEVFRPTGFCLLPHPLSGLARLGPDKLAYLTDVGEEPANVDLVMVDLACAKARIMRRRLAAWVATGNLAPASSASRTAGCEVVDDVEPTGLVAAHGRAVVTYRRRGTQSGHAALLLDEMAGVAAAVWRLHPPARGTLAASATPQEPAQVLTPLALWRLDLLVGCAPRNGGLERLALYSLAEGPMSPQPSACAPNAVYGLPEADAYGPWCGVLEAHLDEASVTACMCRNGLQGGGSAGASAAPYLVVVWARAHGNIVAQRLSRRRPQIGPRRWSLWENSRLTFEHLAAIDGPRPRVESAQVPISSIAAREDDSMGAGVDFGHDPASGQVWLRQRFGVDPLPRGMASEHLAVGHLYCSIRQRPQEA